MNNKTLTKISTNRQFNNNTSVYSGSLDNSKIN